MALDDVPGEFLGTFELVTRVTGLIPTSVTVGSHLDPTSWYYKITSNVSVPLAD